MDEGGRLTGGGGSAHPPAREHPPTRPHESARATRRRVTTRAHDPLTRVVGIGGIAHHGIIRRYHRG